MIEPNPPASAPRPILALLDARAPEDREAARAWLARHPLDVEECVAARSVAPPAPLSDDELAEARTALRRWGAGEESHAALDALGRPGTLVVVAGQQPGILAGPLLTIYKALGAVRRAREIAATTGRRVVPVFWIASEDDDFAEVRRAWWPAADGRLEEVLHDEPEAAPGRMIGTLPTARLGATLVERVRASVHRTEFLDGVLATIEAAHAHASDSTAPWEDAFARLLLAALPGSGIIPISPLAGWVRRRGAAIGRRELETAGLSTRRALERAEALRSAGREPALHRRPDAVNLFHLADGLHRRPMRLVAPGRLASLPPGGAPGDPIEMPVEAWIGLLDADPTRFAWNVVTRPMVQDSILPTIEQVVGPGEAAYLAQVEGAYAEFGVLAPIRRPRPSALLVPAAAERAIAKFELPMELAARAGAPEMARHVLERDLRSGALGELEALHRRHLAELADARDRLAGDSGVAGAFARLVEQTDRGHATIRERMLYSRQEDERRLAEAMGRVERNLRPAGLPQERAANPFVPFAIQYGPDWAARLDSLLDHDSAATRIIRLKDLPASREATPPRTSLPEVP